MCWAGKAYSWAGCALHSSKGSRHTVISVNNGPRVVQYPTCVTSGPGRGVWASLSAFLGRDFPTHSPGHREHPESAHTVDPLPGPATVSPPGSPATQRRRRWAPGTLGSFPSPGGATQALFPQAMDLGLTILSTLCGLGQYLGFNNQKSVVPSPYTYVNNIPRYQ